MNMTFGLWAGTAKDWGKALDTCNELHSTSPVLGGTSTAPEQFWALALDFIVAVQLLAKASDPTVSVATLVHGLDFVDLLSFPVGVLDLDSATVAEAIFVFEMRFLRCVELLPFFFAVLADLLPTT